MKRRVTRCIHGVTRYWKNSLSIMWGTSSREIKNERSSCVIITATTMSVFLRTFFYNKERNKQCRKYTYNLTLWRVRVTTVSMETKQYVLFIIFLRVRNVSSCLHFIGCPKSLIHLGLKRSNIWSDYVISNNKNVIRPWIVVVYKDLVHWIFLEMEAQGVFCEVQCECCNTRQEM